MAETRPQIVFVTGKGGVGKSSVALAYALRFAEQGLRTLVVELSSKSYYSDFLQVPELGHSPQNLRPHLDGVCWAGERCLREYVLHYLRLENLYRVFFENRVMKALIDVAPGLKEISLLGKITSGVRHVGPEFTYERVVVDCFATGHALAFFQVPAGLAASIPVGPMGEQSRAIDRVLRDPAICHYKIVTLFEELPVSETEELQRGLHDVLGVRAEILVNKVMSIPLTAQQLERAIHVPGYADFARTLVDTRLRQECLLQRLQQSTGVQAQLPLQLGHQGWELIEHLKEHLPA